MGALVGRPCRARRGRSAGEPGKSVSIVDPNGIGAQKPLDVSPGTFAAPAWSADSQGIIVAIRDDAGAALYLAGRDGLSGTKLARVTGGVTFDLSPDGSRLAFATLDPAEPLLASQLSVLDLGFGSGRLKPPAAPAPRLLGGSDVVAAFFWSPDSSRIAYLVPAMTRGDESTILFTLKVLNVRTGAVRRIATFEPTPFFLQLARDFGQYGESMRLWSPDGRFLLYCAMTNGDPALMVAYADMPIAPRRIANGVMASWSPR